MEDWRELEHHAYALVLEFQRRVTPVVSISLDKSRTIGINRFLATLNSPGVNALLWSTLGEKSTRLVDGINSSVRETLTITWYHHSRLREMDDKVIEVLKELPVPDYQVIAGGNTVLMNAECQAMILAARRCLDQLAFAISACFKLECRSYRKFGNFLLKRSSQPKWEHLAQALMPVYYDKRSEFEGWLYDDSAEQSIRDRIAHEESISVGTLNVTKSGVIFVRQVSFLPSSHRGVSRISPVCCSNS